MRSIPRSANIHANIPTRKEVDFSVHMVRIESRYRHKAKNAVFREFMPDSLRNSSGWFLPTEGMIFRQPAGYLSHCWPTQMGYIIVDMTDTATSLNLEILGKGTGYWSQWFEFISDQIVRFLRLTGRFRSLQLKCLNGHERDFCVLQNNSIPLNIPLYRHVATVRSNLILSIGEIMKWYSYGPTSKLAALRCDNLLRFPFCSSWLFLSFLYHRKRLFALLLFIAWSSTVLDPWPNKWYLRQI
jgi:hypothetical protein